MFPFVTLLFLGAIIWYLGTGRFGRAQTQAWIDWFNRHPRMHAFLDKHHGKFRASGHYFEFGGLFLVLYWCWDAWFGNGNWQWLPMRAAILGPVCAVAAYLDEVHQLQSGTRQFRRVDFLHSLCGIALSALFICYQSLWRLGL